MNITRRRFGSLMAGLAALVAMWPGRVTPVEPRPRSYQIDSLRFLLHDASLVDGQGIIISGSTYVSGHYTLKRVGPGRSQLVPLP